MQAKKESVPTKQEEKKTQTKVKLGKAQVAMLSIASAVLVFLLAFSCYGCSYQPPLPPSLEEAEQTFSGLYNATWELDTAMGTPVLPEIFNMAVEKIVISKRNPYAESSSAFISVPMRPDIGVDIVYKDGYGFLLQSGDEIVFNVKLLYSKSKDEKTEIVTLIGNESNTRCYYLKK